MSIFDFLSDVKFDEEDYATADESQLVGDDY